MTTFFYNNASLPVDSFSYVERNADQDLLSGIKRKILCCVYAPRMRGKTSLMKRTCKRLSDDGFLCAEIDVSAFMSPLAVEWYYSIFSKILSELSVEFDLDQWWEANSKIVPSAKFVEFLKIILQSTKGRNIVIFFDEMDTCIKQVKKDQTIYEHNFFDAIRYFYEQRANNPELYRINFVFLGLEELYNTIIKNNNDLSKAIVAIKPNDFNLDEAKDVLVKGFSFKKEITGSILDRIFYWTNGQPFLTQTLCIEIKNSNKINDNSSNAEIIKEIEEIINNLCNYYDCNHLKCIENKLTDHLQKVRIIENYYRLLNKEEVLYDPNNEQITFLIYTGLIAMDEDKKLFISNRIYSNYFNKEWCDNFFRKQVWFGDNVKKWIDSNKKRKYLLKNKELVEALLWKGQYETHTSKSQDAYLVESQKNIHRIKQIRNVIMVILVGIGIIVTLFLSYEQKHIQNEKEIAEEIANIKDSIDILNDSLDILNNTINMLKRNPEINKDKLKELTKERDEYKNRIKEYDSLLTISKKEGENLRKDIIFLKKEIIRHHKPNSNELGERGKRTIDSLIKENNEFKKNLKIIKRGLINNVTFIAVSQDAEKTRYYKNFVKEFMRISTIEADLQFLDIAKFNQTEVELRNRSNTEFAENCVDIVFFIKDKNNSYYFDYYTSIRGRLGGIEFKERKFSEMVEDLARRLELLK